MSVTIILGAIIAVIFAIGISNVYAERSTIEVPFDYHGTSCTFDREQAIYTCIWQGSTETITKKGIQDAGEIPPEQILEESKTAHELAIEDEVEIKLTEAERIIKRIQDKIARGSASNADTELLRVLEEVQTKCYFGVDEGRLIQKFQEFNLPDTDTDHNPKTNIKYNHYQTLGKIYKLLEACEAWDVYKTTHLGPEYINKVDDDSTTQKYHGDTDIAAFNTHELSPEDYANSERKAKNTICGHSYYSKEFKENNGCFPNPVIIPGAGIAVDTPGYRAYLLYKSTDFVDIATLKKAEVEKAIAQSLESFALQHGIDLADLKNLVQNVDEYNEAQKP